MDHSLIESCGSPSTRVLVLATTFPRWKGDGTPAFVAELSSYLARRGMHTLVLAPHAPGAQLREVYNGVEVRRFAYFRPLRYQRLCYSIIPNLRRSHLAKLQVPSLVLSELWHAFRICSTQKVDVIHSHWLLPSGLVGALCHRFLGVKHVLTLHGADLFSLEKLPFRTRMATFVLSNCDQATVVSSQLRRRLLQLLPDQSRCELEKKVNVVPMGVHAALFNTSPAAKVRSQYETRESPVILFMGRLADKKGVSYLLEAMPQVLSEFHDALLIICGEGPLRENLEERANQLGLGDSVRFVGYVNGQKKVDYFSLADMVVVPSIVDKSGDTEGLPVVILEAMAAGKPTIASDVGGIAEVISDGCNGLLVKSRSPEDIANKVRLLARNSETRARLGEQALQAARDYDWSVIGGKYERIIRTAIKSLS